MKKQKFKKTIKMVIGHALLTITRLAFIILGVDSMALAFAYSVDLPTKLFWIVLVACLAWFAMLGMLAAIEIEDGK